MAAQPPRAVAGITLLCTTAPDHVPASRPRLRGDAIDALFIGGSTEFKLGDVAADFARQATDRGKWVHWGRVNTRKRFDHIVATGAADSFDGSSFARWRKTLLDTGLGWTRELELIAALAPGISVISES